jgi:RNA-directed DNA polymerase
MKPYLENKMTYREFLIPKRNKGTRKITAPDAELLAYQRSALPRIEALWADTAAEYGVEDVQYGFITGRNVVTAANNHIGYRASIGMDIADFFDSVTTEHIRPFSEDLANDTNLFHADGYCSQGFATSPMLANLALIPALQELDEYLHNNPEIDFATSMTVYADDVTVSANTEDMTKLVAIIEAVTTILANHGFTIKPTKTRIRFARYGYRRMLGIMVGDNNIKVPRKIKYRMRAAKFQGNHHSLGGLVTWSRLQLPKALR